MKRFVLLVTIIMCVVLTGCQSLTVSEEIEVSAVIAEVQYKAPYILQLPTYDSISKTTKIRQQPYPAQYLVTITYKDISETFNDRDLYESVAEGDTIQIVLYKVYDKDGNLIKQTLQFPE